MSSPFCCIEVVNMVSAISSWEDMALTYISSAIDLPARVSRLPVSYQNITPLELKLSGCLSTAM